MDFKDYLKLMVKYEASDVYLTTGAPASARIQGIIKPIEQGTLPAGRVKQMAYEIMDETKIAEFELKPEMNLAIGLPSIGRFRVNIFKQRNEVGMVIRHIKTIIPSLEELGLPPILKKLVMQKRGLILFVGGTGSGKSTSLAALVDYRNSHTPGHIITIEDPIEFIHPHKKSIPTETGSNIESSEFLLAIHEGFGN